MIIKTPITLMIVAMIPRRLSHDGTLSMRIQPISIFTAVLINAETTISLYFCLFNNNRLLAYILNI